MFMSVVDGTSRLRKVLLCKPEFLVSAAPINGNSSRKPLANAATVPKTAFKNDGNSLISDDTNIPAS